jgi:hypothetical protein
VDQLRHHGEGLRLGAFLDAWNAPDLDRIIGMFAPDAAIEDELVVIDPDHPTGKPHSPGAW